MTKKTHYNKKSKCNVEVTHWEFFSTDKGRVETDLELKCYVTGRFNQSESYANSRIF